MRMESSLYGNIRMRIMKKDKRVKNPAMNAGNDKWLEWLEKYNVVLQCGVSSKQTVNEGSDTNRPDRIDFYRFLLDFLAGKLHPPTFERAGRTKFRTNFSS